MDGTVHKGIATIRELATTSHFQELYIESGDDNEEETSEFLSHIPSLIKEEDNHDLLRPFTEEEISKVV